MSSPPLRKCPNCSAYFTKQIKGVTGLPSCPLCRQRLPETRQQPKPKGTKPNPAKTPRGRRRVRRLMARDGPNCWICGTELTMQTATLDHIIPRSKRGTFALANLRLACSPCNNRRGNNDVIGLNRHLR